MKVLSIDHLVLNVSDVDVAADWYGRALGVVREEYAPGGGPPIRTSL